MGSALRANGCLYIFRREVLRLSDSLDELGPISWKLALCLAAVWLICYFCVWKGVKSTGKVSLLLRRRV